MGFDPFSLTGIAIALALFLGLGALFVATGLLDRHLGHHSVFQPYCSAFGVLTLLAGIWLFVTLTPWLVYVLVPLFLLGVLLLLYGLGLRLLR